MARSQSKTLFEKLTKRIQGVEQVLPGDASLHVLKTNNSKTALLALLESILAPARASIEADQAAKAARIELSDKLAAANRSLAAIDAAIRAYLGPDSPMLPSFGIKEVRTQTPLTVEAYFQRSLKAKETRRLRGTLGPKQKLAIKCTTVPAVIVDDSGSRPVSPEPVLAAASGPVPPATDPVHPEPVPASAPIPPSEVPSRPSVP